ncbi:tellurite resistance protein [Breoghania corrubedonensis]|uniref:Tellurite resistance protein n=1 Tax=Breoghania corrubedonensis TaxID=665038 RepID=A0A2T5V909_9HYPH|nr:SLAC1 anion channel family protein [Breoghania corrubedonensis]PTW60245.1 tellurite resistance protein [Breoghania corrubedonensis]
MTAASLDHAIAEPRLKNFPVSFFSIVMGLAGLTLATQRLQHTVGGNPLVPLTLLGLTILAFIIIAVLYAVKAARYPQAVAWEWNHPVRISFFPAISISLILIGTAMAKAAPGSMAVTIWAVGTGLHLIGTLAVVSAWIGHRSFEAIHINPAWFIPAVGNILVPVAGVGFGFAEVSWFFFSVGLLFWLVLLTLVFNRLIFHNPLPAKLVPTLVILIAPPAVGFIAYFQFHGVIDPFSRVLYNASILFFLIIAAQLPRLGRLPYALSWWAYSFPVAAFTIATLLYADMTRSAFHRGAGVALYGLLICVIALLVAKTVQAMRHGEICVHEG